MMTTMDHSPVVLPNLHDFQLMRLSAGQGEVEVTFQLEGAVVHIRVIRAILARFEGDLRTMYIDAIEQCFVDGHSLDELGLNGEEEQAVRAALHGLPPRRRIVLKAIGIAGLNLLLIGENVECVCETVHYEEPEVTPEEQARSEAIRAMLTGIVADHGNEGLKDAKLVTVANLRRGKTR